MLAFHVASNFSCTVASCGALDDQNQEGLSEDFPSQPIGMMPIDRYFSKGAHVPCEHKKIQSTAIRIEKQYRQTQLPAVTVLLPSGIKRTLFKMPYSSHKATLPTTSDLINEYKTRTWSENQRFVSLACDGEIPGYLPRGSNVEERKKSHEEDRNLLLAIMKVHNEQYSQFIDTILMTGVGVMQKVLVKDKEHMFVRADLHSDLATLIVILDFLKKEGKLDEAYHCKNGFKIFLLGDYTDRGVNDIEVLSLLLTFLRENPSVILLRGNHEDIYIHKEYSAEADWIENHKAEFTRCYSSFSLGICVAEEEGRQNKGGRREYIHCSHAGFNPSVDLEPLFSGSFQYMVIPQLQEISERFSLMKKTPCGKQSKAFLMLEQQIPPSGRTAIGYMWNDIDRCSRASPRGVRGAYVMTPRDFHCYAQIASKKDKIKEYLRGHQHVESEFLVFCKSEKKKKIIITTLAVGTKGFYGAALGHQSVQGLLLEAAPRMRDWKKIVVRMDETGPAYLDSASYGMYESIN